MARYADGYTMRGGQLVPIAPPNPRRLTILQFMARLSEAEQLALTYARLFAPDLDVRAALELLKETRDNVDENRIDLDDPRTARGQEIALAVLAGLPEDTPGRIDPADVPARLAAWRADYPQPGEPTT